MCTSLLYSLFVDQLFFLFHLSFQQIPPFRLSRCRMAFIVPLVRRDYMLYHHQPQQKQPQHQHCTPPLQRANSATGSCCVRNGSTAEKESSSSSKRRQEPSEPRRSRSHTYSTTTPAASASITPPPDPLFLSSSPPPPPSSASIRRVYKGGMNGEKKNKEGSKNDVISTSLSAPTTVPSNQIDSISGGELTQGPQIAAAAPAPLTAQSGSPSPPPPPFKLTPILKSTSRSSDQQPISGGDKDPLTSTTAATVGTGEEKDSAAGGDSSKEIFIFTTTPTPIHISPRKSTLRTRRISIPPMDGASGQQEGNESIFSSSAKSPESPLGRRVHFGFYEEIPPFKEEEEEDQKQEESGVGEEGDKQKRDSVLNAEGTNQGDGAEAVEEEEEACHDQVLTWSCPNKYKAKRRALSFPTHGSDQSDGNGAPTMITNEMVAAMLRSKRSAKGGMHQASGADNENEEEEEDRQQLTSSSTSSSQSFQSAKPPSGEGSPLVCKAPPNTPTTLLDGSKSGALSCTATGAGSGGKGNVARRYSIGLLRLVGLYSPASSSCPASSRQKNQPSCH